MMLFLDTTDRSSYLLRIVTMRGVTEARLLVHPKERRGDALFDGIAKMLQRRRLTGVIVISGPGHFSGVRHGVVAANTLAYAYNVSVVGVEKKEGESERTLIERGFRMLKKMRHGKYVVPVYGRVPNVG